MQADERERFGALAERVEALKERLDRIDDRGFTSSQTWLVIGGGIVTALIASGVGAVLTLWLSD